MSWEVWTMKSRISFCDKTVLRKDILRFAPLWGIYFVGGLLVMLTLSLEENAHTLAQALGICIGIFSIINMIYAALVAQLKYSVIVIASVPLLTIYPFIQKYFEKGVMLGSVKG